MVFNYIGRQLRRFNDYCATDTRGGNFWRTTRNTALGYGGIKLAGSVAAAVTGNRDLEHIADIAAPLSMGAYAIRQSGSFSDQNIRDMIIVGIAMVAGADAGSEIHNSLPANSMVLESIAIGYSSIHAHVANKIGVVSNPSGTGALIGGSAGALGCILRSYLR